MLTVTKYLRLCWIRLFHSVPLWPNKNLTTEFLKYLVLPAPEIVWFVVRRHYSSLIMSVRRDESRAGVEGTNWSHTSHGISFPVSFPLFPSLDLIRIGEVIPTRPQPRQHITQIATTAILQDVCLQTPTVTQCKYLHLISFSFASE